MSPFIKLIKTCRNPGFHFCMGRGLKYASFHTKVVTGKAASHFHALGKTTRQYCCVIFSFLKKAVPLPIQLRIRIIKGKRKKKDTSLSTMKKTAQIAALKTCSHCPCIRNTDCGPNSLFKSQPVFKCEGAIKKIFLPLLV